MRLFIFRIMSPLCLCKFHFRRRDEVYETMESYERFNLNIKQKKPVRIKNSRNGLISKLDEFLNKTEQSNSHEKDVYEEYGRIILKNLRTLNKMLLLNKKQLDFEATHKAFLVDGSVADESLEKCDETVKNIFEFAKDMYIEEWKQVALILDRLVMVCFFFAFLIYFKIINLLLNRFFYIIFLILQPLTVLIFFRVDVFEYISSRSQEGRIPNLSC